MSIPKFTLPRAMRQADLIRKEIGERFIAPAREAGLEKVTIRASDVAAAMKLTDRMPNVCNALRGAKLQSLHQVTLVKHVGPREGANASYTYRL